MCGLLFYYSKNKACNRTQFSNALATLDPRGPDSCGYWFSANNCIVVGHTRLEVNGDANAAQPMHGEDQNSLLIAVNGEIYNHRSSLENQGVEFKSDSDSEFLLHQFHL